MKRGARRNVESMLLAMAGAEGGVESWTCDKVRFEWVSWGRVQCEKDR